MDKKDLLMNIAEEGYNVGFGAKKHFATYEIVEKAPGWISLLSFAVAVFALYVDDLANNKFIAASLIVLGVAGMYITYYNDKKELYREAGEKLIGLFAELKDLYYNVKSSQAADFSAEELNLKDIRSRYYSASITKQIFLSDWAAHHKFFWQQQIDWVNEQKNFKFIRDKLPLSFVVVFIVGVFFAIFKLYPCIANYINLIGCVK